jgi:predicted aldo/keto reductase-like oxidoreductase
LRSKPSEEDCLRQSTIGEMTISGHKLVEGVLVSNRRTFLKTGAAAGAATLLPATSMQVHANTEGVKSYHRLGRTDLEVSDISFGTTRLRSGTESLVDYAIDKGINYFDCAESYARGQAETVLGNALKGGKRENVYVVSKSMLRPDTSAAEMMRRLEESLGRLQTDYVDIYMSHAVNDVAVVANPEWVKFVDQAKAQGKIRFSGISGHGGYLIDCVDYALDNDMIDVMLTAYNFGQDPKFYEGLTRRFDWVATQEELPRVIKKAKSKDVGVVAMKTLMGARMNDMRPYEKNGSTFSQAAFKWVLANQDVDALIITMGEKQQIDEFLGASGAQEVAAHEVELLQRYAILNGGTHCRQACNACEGACPYEVPIADVMRTRMYATDYQDLEFAREEYAMLGSGASACLSCSGQPCQDACPNGLEIDKLCAPTHRMLTSERLA